jgi:hypothetical protein
VDLGEFLWRLLVVYIIFFYFMILFRILGDLFSDHETSGGAKTGWIIFLLSVPFLAIFVYLITRRQGKAERAIPASQSAQAAQKDYIRQAARTDPATQIASGQELLKTGAISRQEFDALTTKALA